MRNASSTPTGLRLARRNDGRNPVGVETHSRRVSQGSSCLATLGFETESRWDSIAPHSRIGDKQWLAVLGTLGFAVCLPALAAAAPAPSSAQFRKTIQPILTEYCYDCHGDGMNKGEVAFDEFKSDDELLAITISGWRC